MNTQQIVIALLKRAAEEREKSLFHHSQGEKGSSLHLHLEGMAMGLEIAASIVASTPNQSSLQR